MASGEQATFSDQELAYLGSQALCRLATVGPDGQPDVVPVGFELAARRCTSAGSLPRPHASSGTSRPETTPSHS